MIRAAIISALLVYPALACPLAAEVLPCEAREVCCCQQLCECSPGATQSPTPLAPPKAVGDMASNLSHFLPTITSQVAPAPLLCDLPAASPSRAFSFLARDAQSRLCTWLT